MMCVSSLMWIIENSVYDSVCVFCCEYYWGLRIPFAYYLSNKVCQEKSLKITKWKKWTNILFFIQFFFYHSSRVVV